MDIKTVSNGFLSETYYKVEHDSGLTIYIMPKKNYKTCYAVFGTNYGSVDTTFCRKGEKLTKVPEGIAHFLEHKLFESEELDAFERYAKTGANANAFTSFDRTCYLFSCADNFKSSLEILIDFVKSPYFTQQTVDKEQGIIGQEIRMYQDNPDWQVLFNLLRGIYSKNPVRIDIAGTVESIAEIDAQILYTCYNTFYNNSNMALAVAGNVTVDEVLEVADRLLKPEEKVEIERKVEDEPEGVSQKYIEQDMHVEIKKFNLGFKEKALEKTDLKRSVLMPIVLDLICGKSTQLFSQLLERELINSSFYTEYFTGRGFAVNIFGGESDKPEQVRDAILERIRSLRSEGVDEKEFEAIRRKKYGSEIKSLNDIETLANGLVNAHFEGYDIFDIFEVYKNITKADAEKLLSDCFDEDKCVLSVIK
ncbi:MAG: pitrilysin family protein [Oscillospiraceae bacterium]|nr:pitrilysin family protein [Oscillospiraceae bacterium]